MNLTRRALLASIDLLPGGYDATRGTAFFEQLLARVREIPGVEAASLTHRMPLGFGGTSDLGARIDGYTPAPNEDVVLYFCRVGSDYLKTMGIGIVQGRDFTDRDTAGRTDVACRRQGPTLARQRRPGGQQPRDQSPGESQAANSRTDRRAPPTSPGPGPGSTPAGRAPYRRGIQSTAGRAPHGRGIHSTAGRAPRGRGIRSAGRRPSPRSPTQRPERFRAARRSSGC